MGTASSRRATRRNLIFRRSVDDGRIVYASGADLWVLDLKMGKEQVVPITLTSDFEQLREHWVKKPSDYLTAMHIAPDGGSAVFTSRGEVFTLPVRNGRIVKVAANSSVRYREARFLPDGKSILGLSTESGETDSGSFLRMGKAKRSNGQMMLRCCGGTVLFRRMGAGWRITTKTRSSGFSM